MTSSSKLHNVGISLGKLGNCIKQFNVLRRTSYTGELKYTPQIQVLYLDTRSQTLGYRKGRNRHLCTIVTHTAIGATYRFRPTPKLRHKNEKNTLTPKEQLSISSKFGTKVTNMIFFHIVQKKEKEEEAEKLCIVQRFHSKGNQSFPTLEVLLPWPLSEDRTPLVQGPQSRSTAPDQGKNRTACSS